jgi:uncharacterized protein
MQTAQRGAGMVNPTAIFDKYDAFLRAGSTGDYVRAHGLEKLPWVARTMAHPAYDEYWQNQTLDKILAGRPSNVATLWTQGLWDQEDMYGANHAWRALKAAGKEANNWLVLGPWNYVQVNREGRDLGPLHWEGDTALQYRRDILLPFLNQHLRSAPPAGLARVTVYNTGENRWEHFETWPPTGENGVTGLTPLYLRAGFRLSFDQPKDADGHDSYIRDPAKPVPFLPPPIRDPFADLVTGSLGGSYVPWSMWLVQDQRFVATRPDVLTYETPVLTHPIHVRGIPIADIRAMTTGTDGDFVVKLIDAYPDRDPRNIEGSGYQLPIAMDIFRGRYRESLEKPTAFPATSPQQIRFELPNVNHVFQPSHRITLQIQSTLFPLYDRNPQTFVPNIFDAKLSDYRKVEVSILRSNKEATPILLPVVQ